MRILICHNFYQQGGGEDQVFAAETELLRSRGHAVETFTVHNDSVQGMGKLGLAKATVWNSGMARQVADQARRHRAEIVHFHNTFPLISPAAYRAARETGAAVVQTLHNYRLMCPAATFFRKGAACEKCLGRIPIPAVVHGCYRGSRAVSAVAAASLTVHRMAGTYRHHVDAYIALTQFAREKFVEGGLPARRLFVKPNFIDPDPGAGAGDGNFALFVGRLTEEKGVAALLEAWKGQMPLPLRMIGDGPMAETVREACAGNANIQWLGRRPLPEVIEAMGRATMLVFPSIWYEGFPRTIVEAYARGTPVVATDLGSMSEIVHPGRTGVLFKPGHLADGVREAMAGAPGMREQARGEFLEDYGAERNHDLLIDIYQHALAARAALVFEGLGVYPVVQGQGGPVVDRIPSHLRSAGPGGAVSPGLGTPHAGSDPR